MPKKELATGAIYLLNRTLPKTFDFANPSLDFTNFKKFAKTLELYRAMDRKRNPLTAGFL